MTLYIMYKYQTLISTMYWVLFMQQVLYSVIYICNIYIYDKEKHRNIYIYIAFYMMRSLSSFYRWGHWSSERKNPRSMARNWQTLHTNPGLWLCRALNHSLPSLTASFPALLCGGKQEWSLTTLWDRSCLLHGVKTQRLSMFSRL